MGLFKRNKYRTFYNNIISTAKQEKRTRTSGIYFENHHIIPKSMNGNNKSYNLVLLTAKEHYICHLLLTKMCQKKNHENSMLIAYHLLSNINGFINSGLYEKMKYKFSKSMSIKKRGDKNYNFGKTRSPVVCKKISISNTGKRRSKKSIEKQKQSIIDKGGQKISIKTREKISLSMKGTHVGKNNPMYGKTHSVKTRSKISEASKAQIWTAERRKKISNSKKGNPNKASKKAMMIGQIQYFLNDFFQYYSILTQDNINDAIKNTPIKKCYSLKTIEKYIPYITEGYENG